MDMPNKWRRAKERRAEFNARKRAEIIEARKARTAERQRLKNEKNLAKHQQEKLYGDW